MKMEPESKEGILHPDGSPVTTIVVVAPNGQHQQQDLPLTVGVPVGVVEQQQQAQELSEHEHKVEAEVSQAEEVQRGTLTWATAEDATRVDGASVVSLAGHEGSVIVLGKMQDGQIIATRDDCQDILLMVELKYKDVLLQDLQAQGQLQHQTDGNHLKPHTISYAAPKTRILNYVTDPLQPSIIKAHPQLSFTTEGQTNETHTIAYTDDPNSIAIGKTHLLAYDTQGNTQTIAYPNLHPLTITKGQTISYISDSPTLSPSSQTITYAEGSHSISKDQTLTFTSGTPTVVPNTHVISFIPESALGRSHIVEYTTDADVNEQGKLAFTATDSVLSEKIETIVFEESLPEPEESTETITGDLLEDTSLKISASDSLKPFPCTACNKRFMRRTNLRAHMASHTSDRPHTCNTCGKSFAMRWDLTLHARLHTGVYQCDVCGKAFSVRGKLERHRRVHSGERPFPCTHCGKAFSDKHNLEAHVKTHSDERPYVCQTCGNTFRSQSHLRAHRRVHSEDTPFACSLCGKTFKWKANLNLHLKVHNGDKIKCDGCDREFTRRGDLVRHRRCHQDNRPHPCTICTKTYADRAALNKHMKSHQDNRPYTCDICSKSFNFLWYLNSHKKMHAELKKFKCVVCDKEFSKQGSLTSHIKVHNPNFVEAPENTEVASTSTNSSSLPGDDMVHNSPLCATDMKVEVNMADIKVELGDMKLNVAELSNVNANSVGVITLSDSAMATGAVNNNILDETSM